MKMYLSDEMFFENALVNMLKIETPVGLLHEKPSVIVPVKFRKLKKKFIEV